MMEINVYISRKPSETVSSPMRTMAAAAGTVEMRAQSTAGTSTSAGARSASDAAGLGRNEFLRLLTTQLRYQDPLDPLKDHEFIAQLAQFSTLEQLQGLNGTMTDFAELQMWVTGIGQAASLIGREVTVTSGDIAETGTVQGVVVRDGVPFLVVNGREYSLLSVVRVR